VKARRRRPVASAQAVQRQESANSARRKSVLVAIGLCVITLLAYSNSFHAGFVLDNRGLILEDPRIRQVSGQNLGLILHQTYWWPYGESKLYRPIATLSYLFNYAVLGDGGQPMGYHWLNFLLHLGNVFLVWTLARRLLRDYWRPVFVGLLWTVHPVLTESVTNIVGRPDLLAGASVLGGLLIYLRSADAVGWRRWIWLAGLMGIATIGFLSKESAVVLPGVIALYELSFWSPGRSLRALLLGFCAISPALQVLLFLRFAALAKLAVMAFPVWDNPLAGASFWTARLTALGLIGKYIALLLWPVGLSCDYSFAQIPGQLAAVSWLNWALLTCGVGVAILAFRSHRAVFFVLGMSFLTLLPAANLFFSIGTILAERFLYLPSLAFATCAVVSIHHVAARLGLPRLAPAALCLIAGSLGVATWARNKDWRDDLSLATAAVKATPNSYKTHSMLAAALFEADADQGHPSIERVIREAERSVAILEALPPESRPPRPFDRAGRYYLAKGDLTRETGASVQVSRRAYERAIALFLACRSIADANERQLVALARAHQRPAPEPDGARLGDLERQLASAYLRLSDARQAYEATARAVDLDPLNAGGYRRLASLLAARGQTDDAAVTLVQGILLTSDMGLRQDLLDLYASGLDTERCATRAQGQYSAAINPGCAIVRRHSCAALARAVDVYLKMHEPAKAERLSTLVSQGFGCVGRSAPLPAPAIQN